MISTEKQRTPEYEDTNSNPFNERAAAAAAQARLTERSGAVQRQLEFPLPPGWKNPPNDGKRGKGGGGKGHEPDSGFSLLF